MGQISKIKVVWLCHFSNKQTRERLPLSKNRYFYKFIKKITRREARNIGYRDFAPWVINLINEFEKLDGIELHIISPQTGLRAITSEFEINGVFYHFYNPDFTLFLSGIFKSVKLWLKLQPSSNIVKWFIRKINPDIINLIGAENHYHSCVVLDIKNIPIYVSCQTVYTNPNRVNYDPDAKKSKNWNIEILIHKKEKYFGCMGRMHRDLLIKNNPNAIVFKMFFPFQRPGKVAEVEKEYDFVCFAAGHGGSKGTEDAIKAIALVKKRKLNVTLNIVGRCSNQVKQELDLLISTLNLEQNVIFHGYFPVHADMHQHIKKSRVAVLPVKMDVIPSTIIESILLNIPVVTYKTTGTPYLNKDGEAILIANIGDTENFAENMLRILESEDLQKKLKTNARKIVEKEFDNNTSAIRLVRNYQSVIDHYNNKTPIPKELLFDLEEFPVY